MKPLRLILATTWLALLVACAGVQKPVSPQDYVESALAQVGALYRTIGDLKAQGAITQEQAKAAIVKTEHVEVQVNQAATLLARGDAPHAQLTVDAALAVLLEIQATLPKPKGN